MKKKEIELVFKGADEKSWQELLDDLRPKGAWINTSPYDIEGECSLCCYLSNKCYNFCPNCGAEMKRKPRDCEHCKHYVERDGSQGCELWNCDFEDKNDG